ncbi:MAG: HEAT repeat domain-containing protein [Planctomycetia bacterium]|nr:HEAT repeat domain-containing protein [Planctomycetia bacterium]
MLFLWGVGTAIFLGGSFLLLREGGLLHCLIWNCYESKPASYWIEAVQDKDPKVARKAINALQVLAPRSPEAVRLLLAMIKADPTPNVLQNTPTGEPSPELAAIALASILRALGPDAREFIPALTELLQDPGVFHRIRACRLLGAMGANAQEAVPALIQALSDEFPAVRDEAAMALKQIDPQRRAKQN